MLPDFVGAAILARHRSRTRWYDSVATVEPARDRQGAGRRARAAHGGLRSFRACARPPRGRYGATGRLGRSDCRKPAFGAGTMEHAAPVWPLVVYCAAVIALVAGMTAMSFVLGQRHSTKATVEPFESGIVTVGYARFRFPVKFYLVAMFFVIFDLETVFIFAWAIAFRDVGWIGYIDMLVFVGVLVAALIYLWRLGALDWGPRRGRQRALYRS